MTYPGTRFPESSEAGGLLPSLARALQSLGTPTVSAIHASNDYDPAVLPIGAATIAESIDEELRIEKDWRNFVNPSVPEWAMSTFMWSRRHYRRARFLRNQGRLGAPMVRRLINIELAHISLMRQGVQSGADWCLIAEDDASCEDVRSLADSMALAFSRYRLSAQPKFVNMSRSFSQRKLRTDGLLHDVGAWGTSPEIRILAATKPITNTVCAVLYRTSFLRELVDCLERIPLEPVVPIDWKLNEAVMRMTRQGQLGNGDCWSLNPAPILQGSM